MKFKVVLCPRCKTARGIRSDAKSATCPRCGKRMDLKKARELSEVESEKELASVVMELNTRLKGGEDIYAADMKIAKQRTNNTKSPHEIDSKDVYTEIAGKLVSIKGREEIIITAVKELCHYFNEFTQNDLNEVLIRIGIDGDEACEEYIARMMENNVIYRPKNGVYSCLEDK